MFVFLFFQWFFVFFVTNAYATANNGNVLMKRQLFDSSNKGYGGGAEAHSYQSIETNSGVSNANNVSHYSDQNDTHKQNTSSYDMPTTKQNSYTNDQNTNSYNHAYDQNTYQNNQNNYNSYDQNTYRNNQNNYNTYDQSSYKYNQNNYGNNQNSYGHDHDTHTYNQNTYGYNQNSYGYNKKTPYEHASYNKNHVPNKYNHEPPVMINNKYNIKTSRHKNPLLHMNGNNIRKMKRMIKIEGNAPYINNPVLYKMILSSILSRPPHLIQK